METCINKLMWFFFFHSIEHRSHANNVRRYIVNSVQYKSSGKFFCTCTFKLVRWSLQKKNLLASAFSKLQNYNNKKISTYYWLPTDSVLSTKCEILMNNRGLYFAYSWNIVVKGLISISKCANLNPSHCFQVVPSVSTSMPSQHSDFCCYAGCQSIMSKLKLSIMIHWDECLSVRLFSSLFSLIHYNTNSNRSIHCCCAWITPIIVVPVRMEFMRSIELK